MSPSEIMSSLVSLAKKAEGATGTNPLVAAAIVENGNVVAEEFHHEFGADHAEAALLNGVERVPDSATLYCTLEPCIHHGKTSPCVNLISSYPFERIVIASPDPHPSVNHSGIRALRELGYEVEVGIKQSMYEWVNRAYFYGVRTGYPWIDAKSAMSADGYIAPESGDSRWITGEESRAEGHLLRSKVDAVMVGANTLRRDDPKLTDRVTGTDRQPRALVVSRNPASLPADSHLLSERPESTTIICPPDHSFEGFEQKGGECLEAQFQDGLVNWNQVLPRLRKRGLARILVEGGGFIIGSLMEEGFVNEYHQFTSGKMFGQGTPSFQMSETPHEVDEAPEFQLLDHARRGDDVYIHRLSNDSNTGSFHEAFEAWNKFQTD